MSHLSKFVGMVFSDPYKSTVNYFLCLHCSYRLNPGVFTVGVTTYSTATFHLQVPSKAVPKWPSTATFSSIITISPIRTSIRLVGSCTCQLHNSFCVRNAAYDKHDTCNSALAFECQRFSTILINFQCVQPKYWVIRLQNRNKISNPKTLQVSRKALFETVCKILLPTWAPQGSSQSVAEVSRKILVCFVKFHARTE